MASGNKRTFSLIIDPRDQVALDPFTQIEVFLLNLSEKLQRVRT